MNDPQEDGEMKKDGHRRCEEEVRSEVDSTADLDRGFGQTEYLLFTFKIRPWGKPHVRYSRKVV